MLPSNTYPHLTLTSHRLALQCYLACIQGLDGQVGKFPQLPQCLRHIARLYFAEEEYEKAVHFVQAEKLYYETAILGK